MHDFELLFIGCMVIILLADFFLMIFPKNLKGEINKKFFALNFIGLISSAGMLVLWFQPLFPEIFGDWGIFNFCWLISLLTNVIRLARKNDLMLKKSQSVACITAGAMYFISLLIFFAIALTLK